MVVGLVWKVLVDVDCLVDVECLIEVRFRLLGLLTSRERVQVNKEAR